MRARDYNPLSIIHEDDEFYYRDFIGHLRLFWCFLAGINKYGVLFPSPMGILEYLFVLPAIVKWVGRKVDLSAVAICHMFPPVILLLAVTFIAATVLTLVMSPVILIGHLFIRNYARSQEKKLVNMKVFTITPEEWEKLQYENDLTEDQREQEIFLAQNNIGSRISATRLKEKLYNLTHNEKQIRLADHPQFSDIMKKNKHGYRFYLIWDGSEVEAYGKASARQAVAGAHADEVKGDNGVVIENADRRPPKVRPLGLAVYPLTSRAGSSIKIRNTTPVLLLVPSLENTAEFNIMQQLNFLNLHNGLLSDGNVDTVTKHIKELLAHADPYKSKQLACASYLYFFHALNNATQGVSSEICNSYHPLVTTHLHGFLGVDHAMTATELTEFRNQETLNLNFKKEQKPTTLNADEPRTDIEEHLRELAAVSRSVLG